MLPLVSSASSSFGTCLASCDFMTSPASKVRKSLLPATCDRESLPQCTRLDPKESYRISQPTLPRLPQTSGGMGRKSSLVPSLLFFFVRAGDGHLSAIPIPLNISRTALCIVIGPVPRYTPVLPSTPCLGPIPSSPLRRTRRTTGRGLPCHLGRAHTFRAHGSSWLGGARASLECFTRGRSYRRIVPVSAGG